MEGVCDRVEGYEKLRNIRGIGSRIDGRFLPRLDQQISKEVHADN